MPAGRRWVSLLVLSALLAGSGCHVRNLEVREVSKPVTLYSPLKAHLRDGSVVVFGDGAVVRQDSLLGAGRRFDVLGAMRGPVNALPLDSVVGLVNFRNITNVPGTIVLSAAGLAAATFSGALLAVAIFGSCPTFYTDSAGSPRLEAEGFSYSIASLFESRDVDALRATPQTDMLSVEVRNEALETHHINHLEVLAYAHDPAARVLPDGRGRLTEFRTSRSAVHASDATGRDVSGDIATVDDRVFATTETRLNSLTASDLTDYIDLDFGTVDTDSVALIVRARNSLLTTVLLYDHMLGGPHAIDWVAQDLERVGVAAELGKWYAERMGLHIAVWRDGQFEIVARAPDVGPIAWKELAIMLPAARGERMRVRITMPADSWRIDAVALAAEARGIDPLTVPLTRVRRSNGTVDSAAARALGSPDEAYLISEPGVRFFADFVLPPAEQGKRYSYLLASQGYYNEWIRPAWLRRQDRTRFTPSDASLLAAMRQWRADKQDLEARFYATRIPVH